MNTLTKLVNIKKILIGLVSLGIMTLLSVLPQFTGAQAPTNDFFGVAPLGATGLGARDPRETIALIIRIFMGFLGTIAIVIVLLGGFKWMTAGGNDEKVGEAKKLIAAGIIGLVIILSSYAITTFVLTQLVNVTNAR